MSGWRIDVEGARDLAAQVFAEGEAAAYPMARAELELRNAASVLVGVDELGSAMSALSAQWQGRGSEVATAISASVGAVSANVVRYVETDDSMAQTLTSASAQVPGSAVPGRGFGPWPEKR